MIGYHPSAMAGRGGSRWVCEGGSPLRRLAALKTRTDDEMATLVENVLASGSRACPDCGTSCLEVRLDANVIRIDCPRCDFFYEDLFAG